MNAEATYKQLAALVASAPNLRSVTETSQVPPATLEWLGRCIAVVKTIPGEGLLAGVKLEQASKGLIREKGSGNSTAEVMLILQQYLAIAELQAPGAVQGAFIPVGNSFDASVALGKILATAKQRLLMVDAYMDERVLTEYAILAAEGVAIALLTDEGGSKPTLLPSARAWVAQWGSARLLEVRYGPPRALHDRVILIDDTEAFILTQSFKDLAARSPASIQKVDPELARMKFDAYTGIWGDSISAL